MVTAKVNLKSACTQLGVSRSGYYAWSKRIIQTQAKLADLKSLYWTHRARCGAPSLVHDMRDLRYKMSERTAVPYASIYGFT